jgi:hypothetical protein
MSKALLVWPVRQYPRGCEGLYGTTGNAAIALWISASEADEIV